MKYYDGKYKFWIAGIVIAFICILIHNFFAPKEYPNRQTITVNAPENMQEALKDTISSLKEDKNYLLEFTDSKSANFTVTEGADGSGKLIAFSPFVAVFNSDEDLYSDCVNNQIFVESDLNSNYTDFDFKKIIDACLSKSGSDLKIYCPSKDSVYWEEFYNFLLFTVNDGYYPKKENMSECIKKVDSFLSTKNIEFFDHNYLGKITAVSKKSIYFMTYVDFANIYNNGLSGNVRIMYPKVVVCHEYYAKFDETGEILFNFLDDTRSTWLTETTNIGYTELYWSYFNTNYTNGNYTYNADLTVRTEYNIVDIPNGGNIETINNSNEEE